MTAGAQISRSIHQHGSYNSDTFQIVSESPSSAHDQLLVLFVPGNPGLIDWYIPFLTHLQLLLPKNAAVYACGQSGHTLHCPTDLHSRTASLQDQVDSKVAFLTELRKKHGLETPVLLIGHSVGCYILQQVSPQAYLAIALH